MSIYRVIDKLEAHVREGTWLPFGYRILSEERLVEYIEKMRSTLPEEFASAKTISTNKERIVRDAQEKAQQIVTEAVQQKNDLVEQEDVVRVARTTADVVLREAEEKARKIRAGADSYAAQVLAELEARREALSPRPATVASQQLADAAAKSKRAAFDSQDGATSTREAANAHS
jgi:vacuolar-type H+-ATPase subunit H